MRSAEVRASIGEIEAAVLNRPSTLIRHGLPGDRFHYETYDPKAAKGRGSSTLRANRPTASVIS